jgi:hypothetical protein
MFFSLRSLFLRRSAGIRLVRAGLLRKEWSGHIVESNRTVSQLVVASGLFGYRSNPRGFLVNRRLGQRILGHCVFVAN